ncbi:MULTISPECIES: hypothetical protein [unclassified Mesorhizobium]|uniref:hypothetical protein n=1 Tax=unclassified Mesorhizobium TaxID=325217 RepID=UPI0012EB2662|nr:MULTISPECIES: hypothetical protein [unclassified Mesorhizobium]WJI79398.1 hypothetical protein NLY34_21310 [Mesorhizobium sp. C374B]WJI85933.1 hypothetical protein NLY42_23705 [Mesorhizobium sp. C372A]
MEVPKDFFTIQSMLTLSGATGATFVVSNALQSALNFSPKWLALAIAEVVVLAGVYLTGNPSPVEYFIGLINGCLVYTSAAGATSVLGGGAGPQGAIARGGTRGAAPDQVAPQRSFLSSWF